VIEVYDAADAQRPDTMAQSAVAIHVPFSCADASRSDRGFASCFAAIRLVRRNKMCDRVCSFHHEFPEVRVFSGRGDFPRMRLAAADADKTLAAADFRLHAERAALAASHESVQASGAT